jgi:hypothetical protein
LKRISREDIIVKKIVKARVYEGTVGGKDDKPVTIEAIGADLESKNKAEKRPEDSEDSQEKKV